MFILPIDAKNSSPFLGDLDMRSVLFILVLMLSLSTMGCQAAAPVAKVAAVSAAKFAAEYMLGKAIDGIWDTVTGKPDVVLLDQRLSQLEIEMARRHPEYRGPVQQLRSRISSSTTQQAYREMAFETVRRLEDVEFRLTALEQRMGRAEKAIDEIKNPPISPVVNTSPPAPLPGRPAQTVTHVPPAGSQESQDLLERVRSVNRQSDAALQK